MTRAQNLLSGHLGHWALADHISDSQAVCSSHWSCPKSTAITGVSELCHRTQEAATSSHTSSHSSGHSSSHTDNLLDAFAEASAPRPP